MVKDASVGCLVLGLDSGSRSREEGGIHAVRYVKAGPARPWPVHATGRDGRQAWKAGIFPYREGCVFNRVRFL